MPILLCYDGSQDAKRAVSVAGGTLGDGRVVVLHVWTPPLAMLADAFSDVDVLADPAIEDLERLALGRAEEVGREGHQLAQTAGLSAELRLERSDGPAWRTILDVADEFDVELIVVGTHGRTAVQSNLLGSVSSAVVHHSARPVLVVPTPEQ